MCTYAEIPISSSAFLIGLLTEVTPPAIRQLINSRRPHQPPVLPLMELEFPVVELAYSTIGGFCETTT